MSTTMSPPMWVATTRGTKWHIPDGASGSLCGRWPVRAKFHADPPYSETCAVCRRRRTVPMTDQQTSRTNITEALRAALERVLAVAMTEEEDWTPAVQDEWAAAAKQAGEVLALAAEPRSDAVTAPDEPTFDLNLREQEWRRRYHAGELSFAEVLREARAASASADEWPCSHPESAMTSDEDVIVCTRCGSRWPNRIEREARAASALVPPLDVPRLRQAMIEHAKRTHGLSMDCDEECAPHIAATYDAAETPEPSDA